MITLVFGLLISFQAPAENSAPLFDAPHDYVLVPAGTFSMGSEHAPDEQPIRRVTLSKPFWLARFEVTQKQWQAVMGHNPSHFQDPQRPVEMITYDDAMAFIDTLNKKLGRNAFRLPTEAEWEYACRLGQSDGQSLASIAWLGSEANGQTHPVGTKNADQLGLHDMRGNVWEWVSGWYTNDYADWPETDPAGPKTGKHRVMRGGDWESDPEQCRCGFRGNDHHGGKGQRNVYGLRLVKIEDP